MFSLSHVNKTRRAFSISNPKLLKFRIGNEWYGDFLKKFSENPKTVYSTESYANQSSEIFGNSTREIKWNENFVETLWGCPLSEISNKSRKNWNPKIMSPWPLENSPEIFKPYFLIGRIESSPEIRLPLRVKFFQLNVTEKEKSN